MALCRELTKKYEEFIRGTVSEFIQWATEEEVRGEFCLIIEKGNLSKGRRALVGRVYLLQNM